MFRARFRKYWCDFAHEYVELSAHSIEDILEYAYRVHKESPYPGISEFHCRGDRRNIGGCLEVSHSLFEKYGYRGSMWLERIAYDGANGEVIVFSKKDRYISPKASKAFDAFGEAAIKRDTVVFGDY